jgi:hypothetical protein
MRHELSEEFAEWAREMGNLVARGLGEILERETERLGGRRSKSTGEIAVLVEQDDRLALGDIVSLPSRSTEFVGRIVLIRSDHYADSASVAV